jgi:hypothetical protein
MRKDSELAERIMLAGGNDKAVVDGERGDADCAHGPSVVETPHPKSLVETSLIFAGLPSCAICNGIKSS